MPVPTLREALENAAKNHVALGHFNFSELVVLKAVADTARELDLPVVVGVSEGEREFVGVRQAAALVKSLREEYELPIFLNADHTHSLEKSIEAAKAGFDLIVFDASNQPFEENVKWTRKAVEAAKSLKPGRVSLRSLCARRRAIHTLTADVAAAFPRCELEDCCLWSPQ
jgi:fructose-bisphosphate aldolase, class II